MSLIGQKLGSYEVVAKLGEGGMGEVYRARDTRLNRDVAIKVLPEAFASDVDRLARFTREAQTLASLNHPNIATIYGIEANAIVMELVDGQDLSALIAAGGDSKGLNTDDAVRIARQIIDALEAAHDIGIVHRDLKPANIKVRDDGSVKVLDFGLAKTLEPEGTTSSTANSPTLTARATQMGVILGTAAYMSPEQARGRAVDKRTDVWAFGCVLYELLAGKKAFEGEDATEIIAAVVKSEPDWLALPASLPANLRTVVTRCLIKDRKARIPDLSVVRYLLDEAPSAAAQSALVPAAPPRTSSRLWQAAAAVLLITTLAAAIGWYRAGSTRHAVTRFNILPPENQSFTAGNRAGSVAAAISPDGRTIAFTAQDSSGKRLLWLRTIDSLVAQPLPGTDGAAYPFWSPDSRYIAYAITGKLMKVAVTGGPPSPLCTLNPGITSRGGTWNADDVLVFNNGPRPLHRVSAAGGEATEVGSLQQGESGRQFPSFLPDGRHFLYHSVGSSEQASGVWVGSLDDPKTTRLMTSSTGAVYDKASGRLLFLRQGTLLAQPFDPGTLKLSGEPVPIGEHVESVAVPGVVAFSVSTTGTLAYGIGETTATNFQMTWVDRKGAVLGTVGPPAAYRGISLSPNGLQIAAHRHEGEGGDIWVTDVKRNSTTRLTFDASQENSSPVWAPGGDRIAYSSLRNGKQGVFVKNADGTGQETRLFESPGIGVIIPFSWTPDGSSVLFAMPGAKTGLDLWIVGLSGEHKAVPVLQTAFTENHGQISPNGKWLAYSSTETGLPEIYVKPPFSDGGKWSVSNGVGNAPRWRGDSHELYYVSGGGKIMAVDIAAKGSAIVPGTPTPLFDYAGLASLGHSPLYSYAVTSDGQRFLISGTKDGTSTPVQQPIVVVMNWAEGIRK